MTNSKTYGRQSEIGNMEGEMVDASDSIFTKEALGWTWARISGSLARMDSETEWAIESIADWVSKHELFGLVRVK